MQNIFEIVSKISTPLGLAGVFAVVFFFLLKQIIAKDIFPSLTKKLSSEIIMLVINKVFILSLIAMLLGFLGYVLSVWVDNSEPTQPIENVQIPQETLQPPIPLTATPNKSAPPSSPTLQAQSETPPAQTPSVTSSPEDLTYLVILVLPSRLSGAKIFVDGQPAIIVEQTPTVVKVKVSKKQTNHQFTAQKENSECSKQQAISSDDVKIVLCE